MWVAPLPAHVTTPTSHPHFPPQPRDSGCRAAWPPYTTPLLSPVCQKLWGTCCVPDSALSRVRCKVYEMDRALGGGSPPSGGTRPTPHGKARQTQSWHTVLRSVVSTGSVWAGGWGSRHGGTGRSAFSGDRTASGRQSHLRARPRSDHLKSLHIVESSEQGPGDTVGGRT